MSRTFAFTALLTMATLLSSCTSPPPEPGPCPQGTPLPASGLKPAIRPFLNGSDIGGGPSEARLFHCGEEWGGFCAQWQKGRGACPRLDFTRENVLAVWGPVQPTSQVRLSLVAIDETDGNWTVYYQLLIPTSSSSGHPCVGDGAEARPYQAAAMSRSFIVPNALHLVRRSNATYDCNEASASQSFAR